MASRNDQFFDQFFSSYTHSPYTHLYNKALSQNNFFADDTHINKSCKPQQVTETLQIVESSIKHVKSWMTDHTLKLNDDKTESLLIHTPHSFSKSTKPTSISVCSTVIPFSPSARNLGVNKEGFGLVVI